MKMKRNIVLSLTAVLATLFAGCNDYLDVNDNPNSPEYGRIPPNLSLSAAQTQSFRIITGDSRNVEGGINTNGLIQLGNIMTNTWAGNVNSFTNPYSDEFRGNITSSFYSGVWDWGYVSIANFQKIIEYNSEDFDNHKAIAMVLKSFYMQYIVDLYGDVPYTEAFQGGNDSTPAYDDDKQIYRDLADQLDQAVALIESADGSDAAVGGEDEMFSGDMQQWMRFANTIKLRLLIRQSDLTDAETVAYINGQLDTLVGAEYLNTAVTINPGYNNTNSARQNPFYNTYGYGITGVAAGNRNLVTASEHAADALNPVADPRRGRIWVLQGGVVVGIEQGDDAEGAPNNPSSIGPAFIPVPVGGTNTSVGSAMDGYVMTLAEVKFLLSEAALKYPSKFPGMDAKALWEQGVQASFDQLEAGSATTYLETVSTLDGFGWDASANKVEAIMTQKWIALMNGNEAESWIDYNRTGFPETPLPLTNNGVGRPKRLMYPVSEYVGNSANVPQQTAADVFSTGPFWAQ